MNERIKQLLYETRIYDGRCGETQGIMTCAKTLNEFAQSIVKECAEVGLDSVEDGDNLDAIMKRVHDNILKHFGIEE